MSLIKSRENFSEQILQDRFIRKTLRDVAVDIDKAQRSVMNSRGFENDDWYNGRDFIVSNNTLDHTHYKKQRFVDMKTRNTRNGKVRKKSHPVHNKIIWGHYNNIIKELHFGFTHAVQEELRNMQD
jgi:hypothetical protein